MQSSTWPRQPTLPPSVTWTLVTCLHVSIKAVRFDSVPPSQPLGVLRAYYLGRPTSYCVQVPAVPHPPGDGLLQDPGLLLILLHLSSHVPIPL